MHKRLFSYGMLIYAVGLVAALALNVEVFERQAKAPATSKRAGLAVAGPSPTPACATAPAVQVVASNAAAEAAPLVTACAPKAPAESLPPPVNVLPKSVEPAVLDMRQEL